MDALGNLYGTAEFGGTSGHYGVVFRLNATGKVKVLHSFTGGADGAFPLAGVVLDASGNVYGTASAGGQSNSGVVFKMDQTGALTVLYSFTGGTDGGQPRGGLARDSAGNLYGTTTAGGDLACNSGAQQPGCGVVFRLDPAGRERVLHRFTGGADGAGPGFEKLVLDDKGNLYGTTTGGGVLGYGVVFAITH